MCLGVIYVDDLYNLQGEMRSEDDEGWVQSESTINWPRVEIPKSWTREWYKVIKDCLPGREVKVVWTYRKSLAGVIRDARIVLFEGHWYERRDERAIKGYVRINGVWEEDVRPCEVKRRPGNNIWIRGEFETELNLPEVSVRGGSWGGVLEDKLRVVKEAMEKGALDCASYASFRGNKKMVAVWMGNRETEEGVMLTREVRGYPNYSGRAELDGPIFGLAGIEKSEEKIRIRVQDKAGL